MDQEREPCRHDREWIGIPGGGYSPFTKHWRCTNCQTTFSAGEFENWLLLKRILAKLENIS